MDVVVLARHLSTSVYELHGRGFVRFLIVPFTGTFLPVTMVLVILIAATGWFLLITVIYVALIEWRASRLKLHADQSGLTVVNLLRRYRIVWSEVRAIWADEGYPGPSAVKIERQRGRLWGVAIQATFGRGKKQRRQIALDLAELGRSYGHGFVTGDGDEVVALRRAGLWDNNDPAAHEAWWAARNSHSQGSTE